MRVVDCYQFRVTRNSELFVDEEEVKDLRAALRGGLPQRQFGDEVRLEVADNCPPHIADFLLAPVQPRPSRTSIASTARSTSCGSSTCPTGSTGRI